MTSDGDRPLPPAQGDPTAEVAEHEAAAEAASGWELLFSWRMVVCVLTGFSSGLPLWVVFTLVQAWLRTTGVDLATIAAFQLLQLPYILKFLWAPLLDRYVPPVLGRRRGWALPVQVLLLVAIAGFGVLDPVDNLSAIAALALVVAFFSATQDVAVDAWRRELLAERELGAGNAAFVSAYRIASLVPGGLSLVLADHLPWSLVYPITACFMLVGIGTTLLAPEPPLDQSAPRSLRAAVVEPIRELFGRTGRGGIVPVLLFLMFYKLGDVMATSLITPFYLDVGFSMAEIGTVAKVVGLAASVGGALIGGAIVTWIGLDRALWVFGVAQMSSILGLAALSEIGPVVTALGVVVGLEYLAGGLGTAAFLGFMQRETDRRFTGTQFALLSSVVAIPRTFLTATTGGLVEWMGWTGFFVFCTFLAVPGMLLLTVVAPWGRRTGA